MTTHSLGPPTSLHGRLYLLDYDPARHRFGGNDLVGYALAASMLTDLHLAGRLVDLDGSARPVGAARPADLLLGSLFQRIASSPPRDWCAWIIEGEGHACSHVRDQLVNGGWLSIKRRMLAHRPEPVDVDLVARVSGQTVMALRDALHGLSADPRSLAVGLLATLGQMAAVDGLVHDEEARRGLRALAFQAVAPIVALRGVIDAHYEDVRAGLGGGFT